MHYHKKQKLKKSLSQTDHEVSAYEKCQLAEIYCNYKKQLIRSNKEQELN